MRPGADHDLAVMVEVHEAAFDGFFLTLLGPSFLHRLYRAFIHDPAGLCVVAEVEESPGRFELVGFAVGTSKPELFFKKLFLRQGMQFALNAFPALLRHPLKVLPRLLSAVRYRGDRPRHIPEVDGAALLSSIGVHPRFAKQGIGKLLLEEFCSQATRVGASRVYLVTDRNRNDAANTLYVRTGFDMVGTQERQNGRIMNTYIRRLDVGNHRDKG